MSDTPQGPDWWQASDDRWYPPPRPQMPGDPEPAPASAPADAGLPPPAAPATGGAYPPSGQAAAPAMAPPGQPSAPPFPPPGSGGGPPMGPAARPPFPPPPGYGPSGYPSGVAPGGGGSTPTALYVAVAVVVLAAVVGLVVVLASRSGGGGSPTSATTTNTSARPATTAGRDPGETTGAISGVKVAESGFSTYQGFSGTAGSYGVVITNTGREPVTNFTVKIAIYDKSDTVIGSHPQTVAKLAPGQELGIGSSITDDLSGGIGKLTVSFEEGFGTAVPEGAFTVSDVAMKTTDFGNDVSFKVASSYREDLENIATFAIFRDAGGKIVGGANGYVALVPAGGRSNGTVSAFDVIPTAKRADVYVDKGFF
jgi:hypothetical protein